MAFHSHHLSVLKSLQLFSNSIQCQFCILVLFAMLVCTLIVASSLLLLQRLQRRQRPLIKRIMQKNLEDDKQRILMHSQHTQRLFTASSKHSCFGFFWLFFLCLRTSYCKHQIIPSTPVIPSPSTMSLVNLNGTVSGTGRDLP
jgi:hypothetical protein